MIRLEELEKISSIRHLNIKNTERDYLLELLLFVLYRHAGRKMIFKGGTALYKLYSLNRFSEDLDFTLIDYKLDLQKLLKKVINDLRNINVSLREKPMYEAEHQTLFSKYAEITSFDVFVMDLNEILVDKIRCIFTRDKARDLYDIWFLLNKGVKFDINIIDKRLRLSNKRYGKEELIAKIEQKRKDWELDLKRVIIG